MIKALGMVQTGNKYAEIYGLRRKICVAVGLIYSISCNLYTEDRLINGATCILKKIQRMENVSEALPKILWVEFFRQHDWSKNQTSVPVSMTK